MWLCTWHHNQGHEALPIDWTERLLDPLEEPLWAHGWIRKEPQDHLQTAIPLQGQGCWNTLEPMPLQPWQGLHPHLFSWDTTEKGTITGMAPGQQTKARLITLAQHVLTPINATGCSSSSL